MSMAMKKTSNLSGLQWKDVVMDGSEYAVFAESNLYWSIIMSSLCR